MLPRRELFVTKGFWQGSYQRSRRFKYEFSAIILIRHSRHFFNHQPENAVAKIRIWPAFSGRKMKPFVKGKPYYRPRVKLVVLIPFYRQLSAAHEHLIAPISGTIHLHDWADGLLWSWRLFYLWDCWNRGHWELHQVRKSCHLKNIFPSSLSFIIAMASDQAWICWLSWTYDKAVLLLLWLCLNSRIPWHRPAYHSLTQQQRHRQLTISSWKTWYFFQQLQIRSRWNYHWSALHFPAQNRPLRLLTFSTAHGI